jgi:5-(carboxyamino)imidazole ribonucleotide synthase
VKTAPLLPGSTIGVLGGGQLGRMFAIAARTMGYRVHTLSPDSDTPTGQVSDLEITAPYEDLDAVEAFARRVDAVTFEFENVPAATTEAIARFVPVRPAGTVLHVTQHRIREKLFLQRAGFPLAPFRVIQTVEDLQLGISQIGCPAILKTADFGYDGKGQVRITSPAGVDAAWKSIGERAAVLEAFVDFECELSVVAARSLKGEFAHYGTLENHHRDHILDFTIAPARVDARVDARAVEITRLVLEQLDAVGVVCVELFLRRDGELIINEIAPRPHNSGHFSIDACLTSQFEQQLRAVCGLPLGSTAQLRPAAMANLLGDLWETGEPDWAAVCTRPEIKLHLYGKTEPRIGRKMGHLTALADNVGSALQIVREARSSALAPHLRVPDSVA